MRQQILSGRFGGDGVLPGEFTLGQEFGVSRTVAREAMRVLRAQGLVEVSQGCRPRVKPPDPQVAVDSLGALLYRSSSSLVELNEVRLPLEAKIAELAALRATPEHHAQLRKAIEDLDGAESLEAGVEADVRFHRLLAEATGNSVFVLLLQTISSLLEASRRRTLMRSGVQVANAGHRRILEAVLAEDSRAAADAMLEHILAAGQDLEEREQ